MVPVILTICLDIFEEFSGTRNDDPELLDVLRQQEPFVEKNTNFQEVQMWKTHLLPALLPASTIFRVVTACMVPNGIEPIHRGKRPADFQIEDVGEYYEFTGYTVIRLVRNESSTDDPVLPSDFGPEWNRGWYWHGNNPHWQTLPSSKARTEGEG
ncbi:MAG: hypothetical protein JWL80_142 [Parcubacteria group bacterium]|nr:hypothetical protein [Parcubacteria group bacterium]